MQPAVSVIIPNYNHAPYLRERIDSVLGQTFGDFELILLDDCSTDNSRDIIDSYRRHPKVAHVVYNDKNSGSTFIQWKRGIELARGKYVWIAESDDVAHKSFLDTLVPLLEANPEVPLAFTGSVIIDSCGNEIDDDWDRYTSRQPEVKIYTPRGLIARKLLRNNGLYNASMVLFRRAAMPAITVDQQNMRFCGDWDFWFRFACRGGGIEVRRKLNRFRQHLNKVSVSANKEGLTYTEGIRIVNAMASYLALTPLQRHVLTGRMLKRLSKYPGLFNDNPNLNTSLHRLSPAFPRHHKLLIALYEADKLLNFSHLPR